MYGIYNWNCQQINSKQLEFVNSNLFSMVAAR